MGLAIGPGWPLSAHRSVVDFAGGSSPLTPDEICKRDGDSSSGCATAPRARRLCDTDRGEAAGGGHCSGTPALRRPSRMGSSWARYVGSSLLAAQRVRAWEMAKVGWSARPALTAERASSSRPSCARAAASRKYASGQFRLCSLTFPTLPEPADLGRRLEAGGLVRSWTRSSGD